MCLFIIPFFIKVQIMFLTIDSYILGYNIIIRNTFIYKKYFSNLT